MPIQGRLHYNNTQAPSVSPKMPKPLREGLWHFGAGTCLFDVLDLIIFYIVKEIIKQYLAKKI